MTRRFHFDLDEPALRNLVVALEQRLECCDAWLTQYSASDDPAVGRLRDVFSAELRDGQALLVMWQRMLDSPPVAARSFFVSRTH